MRRVIIKFILISLLLTISRQRVFISGFISNEAMLTFVRCFMPAGWVSDPDRAQSYDPQKPAPSSSCLDKVRQGFGDSRRMMQRLEVIAGDIAASRDQWQEAVAHYKEAAQLADHPVPDIWSTVVSIYIWRLKDYQAAFTILLPALHQSPQHELLRMYGGMLYLFYLPPYGNYVQAIAVMRPELGFSHPYYYTIAAGSYLAIGKYDDALRMSQEAVRLSRIMNDPGNKPNLVTGLYLLGFAQRCTGQSQMGFTNLREAQALSPQDENIKAALGEDITNLCKSYGKAK